MRRRSGDRRSVGVAVAWAERWVEKGSQVTCRGGRGGAGDGDGWVNLSVTMMVVMIEVK